MAEQKQNAAQSGGAQGNKPARKKVRKNVLDAIAHVHAITGKIAGADIVEFNPVQDSTQITATVAAKLLKEILGKMDLN